MSNLSPPAPSGSSPQVILSPPAWIDTGTAQTQVQTLVTQMDPKWIQVCWHRSVPAGVPAMHRTTCCCPYILCLSWARSVLIGSRCAPPCGLHPVYETCLESGRWVCVFLCLTLSTFLCISTQQLSDHDGPAHFCLSLSTLTWIWKALYRNSKYYCC